MVMIKDIKREIIWNGRKGGFTWFHPRAGRLPDGSVLMTCQDITGSDNFGQVHWSKTTDNGANWSQPEPIPAFARKDVGDGFEECVCDAVPEYHAATGKVLLMGHNVFYKHNACCADDVLPPGYPGRHSVYCVGDGNGNWGERQDLVWENPEMAGFSSCGCAQSFTLDNGDILVPMYFAAKGETNYSVTTMRYSFDGQTLHFQKAGTTLNQPAKRGLQEPSITSLNGVYYLTIRAEDDRGYFSTSSDGLNWSDIKQWSFDDGEVLQMSTTQQHWLTHSDGLFLVYTRRTEDNYNVMRWRAPLFVAQMDTAKQCLIRSTEQIVFPMIGDGIASPDLVARMGNFHVTNVSPEESWITVGETRPHQSWHGNTLQARVYWELPNNLL
jgi:hypothetical protein